MPCKLALSPLQNRVLWVLEEAGEESIATVKATVRADDETLDREIAALERLAFVQRATQAGRPSLVLTSRGRDALTT
jgi:DNA-binding MarR family transcriptional regulator